MKPKHVAKAPTTKTVVLTDPQVQILVAVLQQQSAANQRVNDTLVMIAAGANIAEWSDPQFDQEKKALTFTRGTNGGAV